MNKFPPIAILKNKYIKEHSTSWNIPWEEYCVNNGLEYKILHPYDLDIINQLKEFSVVLWHFSGYIYSDMLVARSILYTAKSMGLKVFPDFSDCWHFDDKISETYLLSSINAPIPKSKMFYDMKDINDFTEKNNEYPLIAKLRNGSGSHNVKLIKDSDDLKKYSKQMFSSGFESSPSLLYKSTSNIKSTKSFKTLIHRIKRVPEFLRTLKTSKEFPNERGYVFLQEFIPNDGFDLKIVVIGDKLSFIGRYIRKGDFRASGGGDLFYDKKVVSHNIIDSAFRISSELGFKCMGYDYVVNKETGEGIIVEMSYGFSHEALLNANGYFDTKGNWISEPLNAPQELLNNLLNE